MMPALEPVENEEGRLPAIERTNREGETGNEKRETRACFSQSQKPKVTVVKAARPANIERNTVIC